MEVFGQSPCHKLYMSVNIKWHWENTFQTSGDLKNSNKKNWFYLGPWVPSIPHGIEIKITCEGPMDIGGATNTQGGKN